MKCCSTSCPENLLTHTLHKHGAAAKPLGHFPAVLELLIQTFIQPYATLLLHLFWDHTAGISEGEGTPDLACREGEAPSAQLP